MPSLCQDRSRGTMRADILEKLACALRGHGDQLGDDVVEILQQLVTIGIPMKHCKPWAFIDGFCPSTNKVRDFRPQYDFCDLDTSRVV